MVKALRNPLPTMKTNKQAIILLSLGGLIAAGCASTGKLAREQAGYPKGKVDAQALYLENCARCHGADGRATTVHGWVVQAQDFTDIFWRTDASNDAIIHAIKTGPKTMPAFEKKLSEAEIEALAAYVQTFGSAPLDPHYKPAGG